MKALICAIIILCAVTLSTIFVGIYSDKLLSDFNSTVDTALVAKSENIDEIKITYQRIKPFLTLFMCDKDVKQLELYIEDAINSSMSDDKNELMATKSRLRLYIDQLRRQSAFSIDAIF